jgi:hypothetical protein
MCTHGFPVPQEVPNEVPKSSVYSENTRAMILDMSQNNLSFFKLIFEKLTLLTVEMDSMRASIDNHQSGIEHIYEKCTQIQDTLNKEPPPKTTTTLLKRPSSISNLKK